MSGCDGCSRQKIWSQMNNLALINPKNLVPNGTWRAHPINIVPTKCNEVRLINCLPSLIIPTLLPPRSIQVGNSRLHLNHKCITTRDHDRNNRMAQCHAEHLTKWREERERERVHTPIPPRISMGIGNMMVEPRSAAMILRVWR